MDFHGCSSAMLGAATGWGLSAPGFICDPDKELSDSERQEIQQAAGFFELHVYHFLAPAVLIGGYGSIPINTIFSGMNIHLPAILMWTTGVLLVLTHCQVLVNISQNTRLLCPDGWELRLPQLCSMQGHRHLGWGKNHSYQAAVLVVKNIASSEWLGFFHNDKVGCWGWLMAENEMTWDEISGGCQYLPVLAAISPVYLCQSLLLVAFTIWLFVK